jgi:hypothetical protein
MDLALQEIIFANRSFGTGWEFQFECNLQSGRKLQHNFHGGGSSKGFLAGSTPTVVCRIYTTMLFKFQQDNEIGVYLVRRLSIWAAQDPRVCGRTKL